MSKRAIEKVFATAIPLIFFLGLLLPVISNEVFAQQRDGEVTGTPSREAPLTRTCTGSECTLTNPFTISTVTQLLNAILDIIIKVGWILAFFFLIYAGFLFVTAAGSEDQINKAKATFMWTVIGSAIVLGAKALAILVETTVKEVVGR